MDSQARCHQCSPFCQDACICCIMSPKCSNVILIELDENFCFYANVNGFMARIILDTGATVSIVNSMALCKMKDFTITSNEDKLFSVSGEPLLVQGKTVLNTTINNIHISWEYNVVDNSGFDVLWGKDLISRADMRIVICSVAHLMAIRLPHNVTVNSAIWLSPGELTTIDTSIDNYGGCKVDFNGIYCMVKDVYIARNEFKQDYSVISVVNTGQSGVWLRKGQEVGKAHCGTQKTAHANMAGNYAVMAVSNTNTNDHMANNYSKLFNQSGQINSAVYNSFIDEPHVSYNKHNKIVYGTPEREIKDSFDSLQVLYDRENIPDHLLLKFQQCLVNNQTCLGYDKQIGNYRGPHMELSLQLKEQPDFKNFRIRQYKYSPEVVHRVDEQLDLMLQQDLIVEEQCYISSPLVVILKNKPVKHPDGSTSTVAKMRLVIDYRQLNRLLYTEQFPVPDIQFLFLSISQLKPRFFSSIDIQSMYYHFKLSEGSRKLTAFHWNSRCFFFKRTCMGLSSSPSQANLIMSKITSLINANLDQTHQKVLYYLDDILLLTSNRPQAASDHIELIDKTLFVLRKFGLLISTSKSHFFQQKDIHFLGHSFNTQGYSIPSDKIKDLIHLPDPVSSIKSLRSYLGKLNFYQKFIKNYSTIVHPLIELTKKKGRIKYEFTKEAAEACRLLRTELSEARILSFPDLHKVFHVFCDSSNYCIGAVLMQKDEAEELQICEYYSRKIPSGLSNAAIFMKEAFAVYEAVHKWQMLLKLNFFFLYIDNKILLHLLNKPIDETRDSKLNRWLTYIRGYDYEPVFVPSLSNFGDIYSRLRINQVATDHSSDTEYALNHSMHVNRVPKGEEKHISVVTRAQNKVVIKKPQRLGIKSQSGQTGSDSSDDCLPSSSDSQSEVIQRKGQQRKGSHSKRQSNTKLESHYESNFGSDLDISPSAIQDHPPNLILSDSDSNELLNSRDIHNLMQNSHKSIPNDTTIIKHPHSQQNINNTEYACSAQCSDHSVSPESQTSTETQEPSSPNSSKNNNPIFIPKPLSSPKNKIQFGVRSNQATVKDKQGHQNKQPNPEQNTVTPKSKVSNKLSFYEVSHTNQSGPSQPVSSQENFEHEWARLKGVDLFEDMSKPCAKQKPNGKNRKNNLETLTPIASQLMESEKYEFWFSIQQKDDEIAAIFKYIEENSLPDDHNLMRFVILNANKTCVINKVVFWIEDKIKEPDSQCRLKIYVPRHHLLTIIKECHDCILNGCHMSYEKNLTFLRQKFYHPQLASELYRYNKACTTCQLIKIKPSPVYNWCSEIEAPRGPFSHISVDLIGPLPGSYSYRDKIYNDNLRQQIKAAQKRGKSGPQPIYYPKNYWILSIVCYFSSLVTCYALPDAQSITIMQQLVEHFSLTSIPECISSDRGANFCSNLANYMYHALGIKHALTIAYSPRSNIVERHNRRVSDALKMLVADNNLEWSQKLPFCVIALNSCPNATGLSAYNIVYGSSRTLLDRKLPNINRDLQSNYQINNHIEAFHSNLYDLHQFARKMYTQNRLKYRDARAKVARPTVFYENEFVFYKPRSRRPKKDEVSKFMYNYHGPFRIACINYNKQLCLLRLPDLSLSDWISLSDLKKYEF